MHTCVTNFQPHRDLASLPCCGRDAIQRNLSVVRLAGWGSWARITQSVVISLIVCLYSITMSKQHRTESKQHRTDPVTPIRVFRPDPASALLRLARLCAGPVERAQRALEHLQQRLFDSWLGVSTQESGQPTRQPGLVESGDNRPYDGCQWLPVRRALRDLAPCSSEVSVDLGAGKGKFLLIAGRLPYQAVTGIEIDEDLALWATRNIEQSKRRLRAQVVECITADVMEWPIPDDASVIFMYNPFIGPTFRTAVSHIFESYDRRPRKLHIVYDYPWEHDWLLSTGRVVVDNVWPRSWPARLRRWLDGNVIVSYRVGSQKEREHPSPQMRGPSFRSRLALQRWSMPNDQRFE